MDLLPTKLSLPLVCIFRVGSLAPDSVTLTWDQSAVCPAPASSRVSKHLLLACTSLTRPRTAASPSSPSPGPGVDGDNFGAWGISWSFAAKWYVVLMLFVADGVRGSRARDGVGLSWAWCEECSVGSERLRPGVRWGWGWGAPRHETETPGKCAPETQCQWRLRRHREPGAESSQNFNSLINSLYCT